MSGFRRPVLAVFGFLAATGLCLLPATVQAQGRLDVEDTSFLTPGAVELELGAEYVKIRANRTWALTTVMTVGILSPLEARIESAALLVEPRDGATKGGLGDTVVGVKYGVVEEASGWPALSVDSAVRLPTGDERRDLGAEGADVQLLVILGKSFGPLTLTWDGGYTFATSDRALDVWVLEASAEYELWPRCSPFLEALATLGTHGAGDTLVLRGGIAHALTARLSVQARVGVGLTRDSPDLVAAVLVTVRF